jgi:hypothetical protein
MFVIHQEGMVRASRASGCLTNEESGAYGTMPLKRLEDWLAAEGIPGMHFQYSEKEMTCCGNVHPDNAERIKEWLKQEGAEEDIIVFRLCDAAARRF